MARKYGYTVKLEAWIEADPSKDEDSTKAMAARAAANKALTDAGFTIESTGKFGHREIE